MMKWIQDLTLSEGLTWTLVAVLVLISLYAASRVISWGKYRSKLDYLDRIKRRKEEYDKPTE